MVENIFLQMGLILGLAVVSGGIAQLLRQPLIVAFIVVGILLGPSALGWVTHSSEIELFSRLGIALLLFVVGLKLDMHIIRTAGPVALASGLGQVIFHFGNRISDRPDAGYGSCHGHLCGRRAHFFQHHHHRQAPLGQTGGGFAAWADCCRLPHCSRYCGGTGHDRPHRVWPDWRAR